MDAHDPDEAPRAPENMPTEAIVRDPAGRFRKGVSGNPGGRPKALLSVQQLARMHTDEAVDVLVEVMRDQKAPAAARAAAANSILSRGWGSPRTEVAISDERSEEVRREVWERLRATVPQTLAAIDQASKAVIEGEYIEVDETGRIVGREPLKIAPANQ